MITDYEKKTETEVLTQRTRSGPWHPSGNPTQKGSSASTWARRRRYAASYVLTVARPRIG